MKVKKWLVVDQNTEQMKKLSKKYNLNQGICGYITCAITKYLSQIQDFNLERIKLMNLQRLTPYIEQVMKNVSARRRLQLKKYYKLMNNAQRQIYISNCMCNYQLADYLQNQFAEQNKTKNHQIFFFRYTATDPDELKFQEKERAQEEQPFIDQRMFYSSFSPYANHFKEEFEKQIASSNSETPVIVAANIGDHFYTVVLFNKQIHILDSLSSYMETKYDSMIVQTIQYMYRKSLNSKA